MTDAMTVAALGRALRGPWWMDDEDDAPAPERCPRCRNERAYPEPEACVFCGFGDPDEEDGQ